MSWPEADADRVGSRHVQIFIPSVDRDGSPIPRGQQYWVSECLRVFGEHFGGATAFPPAQGVWRDDERNGQLVYDETVIVFSYVHPDCLTTDAGEALMRYVRKLGAEGRQGEVGLFVDGVYYGIQDFEEPTIEAAPSNDPLKGGSNE